MNPRLLMASLAAALIEPPRRPGVAVIDCAAPTLSTADLIEFLELREAEERLRAEAPKMALRPEAPAAPTRRVYVPRPQTISVRQRIQKAETLAALDEILSIASRMQNASDATRTQWLKAAKQRQAELLSGAAA